MKGKVLFILCSLLMLTACAFGFSACGESGNTTDGGNGNGSGNNGNTDPPPVIHIHEMEYSPAVDATCTEDGSIEFWYCSDCGKYYADEDGVKEIQEPSSIPATGHSWSEWSERKPATCTNEGEKFRKCENCGEEETELVQRIAHTMQFNVGKPSTCTETGLQDSYYCTLCKQYFHDELGEQPVTYEDLIIPTTNHSLNGYAELVPTCTISGHTAYFLCTDCGQYFYDYECTQPTTWEEIFRPAAGHTMTHYDAVLATCTENGNIEYWYCSSCDKRFADNEGITELSSITTLATGHLGITYFLPKEPTCTEDGYIEHYHCPTCNKNFADTHGDNELLSITIEALHHNSKIYHPSSEATCIQYGNIEYWECWYCHKLFYDENATKEITDGSYLIAPKGHAFSDEWMSDETHHWRECVNCDEVTDQNEHTWDSGVVTIEPTCTETGIRTYTCTVCQATKTEEIAPKGHAFSDEWMSDETHHWRECVNCDEVTDQSEHIWDSGVVTEKPTCTETGIKTYTCTACQATKTEVIVATGHSFSEKWIFDGTYHWHAAICEHTDEISDKTQHNFVNGKCTVCGIAESGAKLEYKMSDGGYMVAGIGSCTDTDVEILSEYNGRPVTRIGMSAFNHCDFLTNIIIPDSITEILSGAFEYCDSLASVTIGNGLTRIMDYAFQKCSNLVCVYISNIVTWCNIDFEDANSNPLFYAKNLYLNSELVTKLSIPNGITSIKNYAFYNCVSLINIVLPETVTSIGQFSFTGCNALANINIPNSIKSIGESAFRYCSSLTDIEIPYGVTNIGDHAYADCTSLISVEISDSVKSISVALFGGCSALTNVTIGNGVMSIESNAFSGCSSLANIVIPISVTSIGAWAFEDCSSLMDIVIPSGVTKIERGVFDGCKLLTNISIPDGVVSIGEQAFWGCASLTSIEIPTSVTSLENYVFYGCKSLTYINIPKGVVNIGDHAFELCTSLTSIELPGGVTDIGSWVFWGCSSLTSISIPNSVTSIKDSAFSGCYALTTINYDGTVEQWNSILKDSNWDINTGDYTIYCLLDDTIIKS